ncbi:MAG: amidohydrolase family protein, partial [bacterium]
DSNHYVLPGIFDLHAHYNVNLFGRKRREEFHVVPIVYLANGVTSTFPAGEYLPEQMLELRKQIDRGEKIGPRIFNSGPYFGPARPGWDPETTAEQIYAEVDAWAEKGAAGFKAKRISRRHLKPLIERAHQHGLTVTGHLDSGYRDTINPQDAILLGIDRVEHFLWGGDASTGRSAYSSLENLEPTSPEFRKNVQLFIDRNVFFDATITAYGYYGKREVGYDYWADEKSYFTPYVAEFVKKRGRGERYLEQFEKIYWVKHKTVKAFFDAGGADLLTLGTDHPSTGEYLAGFSAHRELEALVTAGIPPGAAIKIATLNGARALNVSEKLGSISTGKFADLFVVNGNPIQEIKNARNVYIVIKAGKLYYAEALLRSVSGKLGPNNDEEAKEW